MPYIHIQVTDEGVSRKQKQKQKLVSGATQLMQDVLNKNPSTTFVVIEEINTDNWGIGGELVTDIRARVNPKS